MIAVFFGADDQTSVPGNGKLRIGTFSAQSFQEVNPQAVTGVSGGMPGLYELGHFLICEPVDRVITSAQPARECVGGRPAADESDEDTPAPGRVDTGGRQGIEFLALY